LGGSSSPPAGASGAARKLVTVLVTDVDEAVEGFADRDPEDVGRLLAGQLARVRTEVEAFGGVVEETVGGRTVAVFGVPRTRDDDAERAVRAALAIRAALTGASAPEAGAAAGDPRVRVQGAVATGEALVHPGEGRGPGARRAAPGDLLAACARLQEAALAGAVLVTEATRQASERAIAYRRTPRVTLPGGAPAWTALAALDEGAAVRGGRPGQDRRAPRFPPLVARGAELGALLEAAGHAATGGGPALVTVLGTAGIGKSRLLAELSDRLAGERWTPTPQAGERWTPTPQAGEGWASAPRAGAGAAGAARAGDGAAGTEAAKTEASGAALAEDGAAGGRAEVPVAWRQGRSLPYGDGPSFGALAEAVKAEVGVLESDAAETAERRLAASVAAAVTDPATAAWVALHLRRLVGIHPPSRPDPGSGPRGAGGPSPGARSGSGAGARSATPGPRAPTSAADREEEFAAWRRFLYGLAAARPLVLALEDLHRADDALLDFVESLVPTGREGAALLVVVTARPELLERRPGWGSAGTTVRLEPLGDADTTGLLATLLAHHGLPTEVDPGLLGRVGGNPLFAEEYVRMLRDRGSADPLPTGVHAIVAARLDALPADERAVLHDAAVLGQVGWVGALGEVGGHPPDRLDACLQRLEAKEFVQRFGRSRVAGEVQYAFRHGLVRDVAYGQVVRADRASKHRRAAAWIEGLAPDRAEDRAELLAYHYRAALWFARATGDEPPGLAERTRTALRDAGDRAAALGGYETAARFHAEALDLCADGDPERGQLLLRLGQDRCRSDMTGQEQLAAAREALLAAGQPLAAAEAEMLLGELAFLHGRGDQRAGHLDRALALVADAPPSASKAAVLRGAMMHLVVAGRSGEARAVGGEVLAMARSLGLRDLEADALGAIGTARVEAGDLGGLGDLEAAIASFDELGTPGGIVWHLNLAWAAAALGDLPRCFVALTDGALRAERFGSLRWRRTIELQLVAECYWTGRWEEAVEVVDALLAGAERHYLEWECRLWRGRIRLARGRLEDALEDAEAALALAAEAGDRQELDPTRTFLARVLLAAGRQTDARAVAGELLDGLGGRVLGPELGVDLGVVLAGLGEQAARLYAIGLPPSPWLAAARAFVAGAPLASAEVYAGVGSRPDEAEARLAAARGLAAAKPSEARAQLAAARAFYASVGAAAFLAEADEVALALGGR
jgi:class 3 adenylate cyclase/tetratricopeptide (TPR) repeat protein